MKKVFDEEGNEKYYLNVLTYNNNHRLCIEVIDDNFESYSDVTINLSEINIDKPNQVYLSNDISGGVKYMLLDKGIISKTINTSKYNLGSYSLVEVNLEKLKEYDEDGVKKFLENNKEQDLFEQYNEKELKVLLDKKERLVCVDCGMDEVIIKYKDIPDFIVDINNKLGSTDLKIFEYEEYFSGPIVTTMGPFLNKCDPNVRNDIINRLVKLQTNEEEVKELKITNEDTLEDLKIAIEQKEMER